MAEEQVRNRPLSMLARIEEERRRERRIERSIQRDQANLTAEGFGHALTPDHPEGEGGWYSRVLIQYLFAPVLLGIGLSILIPLLGDRLFSPWAILVVLLSGTYFGFVAYESFYQRFTATVFIAGCSGVFFLIYVAAFWTMQVHPVMYAIGLTLMVVELVLIADCFATKFLMERAENEAQARETSDLWGRRFRSDGYGYHLKNVLLAFGAGIFLFFSPALCDWVMGWDTRVHGGYGVLTVAAALLVGGVIMGVGTLSDYPSNTHRPREIARRFAWFLRHLAHWLSYPGENHSNRWLIFPRSAPGESGISRRVAFYITTALLVGLLLPASGYFSVGLMAADAVERSGYTSGLPEGWRETTGGSPYQSVSFVVAHIRDNPELFAPTFVVSIVLCVLVPVSVVLSVMITVAYPVLAHENLDWLGLSNASKNRQSNNEKHSDPLDSFQMDLRLTDEDIERLFGHLYEEDGTEDDRQAHHQWKQHVRRLLTSDSPAMRDHVFLGLTDGGDPITVPRQVLHEGCNITGDPGSNKTSALIGPLASQLIAMAGRNGILLKRNLRRLEDWRDEMEDQGVDVEQLRARYHEHEGQIYANCQSLSVVILDNKGDMSAMANARIEAERMGLPFRVFSPSTEEATHVFNPLHQSYTQRLALYQRAEVLLGGLGLDHGDTYGAGHFSLDHRESLTNTIRAFPGLSSFREMHYRIRHPESYPAGLKPSRDADRQDLARTIQILSDLDQMNITPADSLGYPGFDDADSYSLRSIDLYDVLENPQVVYFYLDSGMGAATAREIARLVSQGLLAAANVRERRATHKTACYLLIDEFQVMISEGLGTMVAQARSKGIATIAAYQNPQQLRNRHVDLTQIMQAMRLHICFSAGSERHQTELMRLSGDMRQYDLSWEERPYYVSPDELDNIPIRVSSRVGPRITRNDLIGMSNAKNKCLIHLKRDADDTAFDGYSFIANTLHHIPMHEYAVRNSSRAFEDCRKLKGVIVVPPPEQYGGGGHPHPKVNPPKPKPPKGDIIEKLSDSYQEQLRRQERSRKNAPRNARPKNNPKQRPDEDSDDNPSS